MHHASFQVHRNPFSKEVIAAQCLPAQAICKQFLEACEKRQIGLPHKNFTLSYDTNIPRQAGLSGSSAIVCAALNCLIEYYDVGSR
jgi:glucuronokinase